MEIFKSATKIVLLLFAVATVVGLFLGKVDGQTFNGALLMILAFYFGQKNKAE